MVSIHTPQREQYNLRWNNYSSNIIKMFAELLNHESLIDVTLICEGEFIKVHKLILSACSDYFQKIFQTCDNPNPIIIMNGVKLKDLKQVVQFMYCGETKVADSDLQSLLQLGESLQIKGLSSVKMKITEPKTLENGAENANLKETPAKVEETKRKKRKLPQQQVDVNKSNGDGDTSSKVKNKRKVVKNQSKINKSEETSTPTTNSTSHIQRPPNAFMIFADEFRQKIANDHPNESNKDISVRLSNMWKALPVETKETYYETAKKAAADHKIKHPGYYGTNDKSATSQSKLINEAMEMPLIILGNENSQEEKDNNSMENVKEQSPGSSQNMKND